MRGLTAPSGVWEALDQRLDFNAQAPIAIAFSGGGDSMALLHMARGWAERRGRPLLALTVDHGLHPDSAAWTAFAGRAARRVGADWRALSWTDEKPKTGVPAAARAARHKLLANAARDAGAKVILFAHTADDVAEGEVMREDGTPTLGHLKPWSPSPVWPDGRGIYILRPLLAIRREALRAFLRHEGLDWLDDPSNDDLRFARARARSALKAKSAEYSHPPLAQADSALATLARTVETQSDGRFSIPRLRLLDADRPIARRLLSAALICASGRATPPRREALDHVLDRLSKGRPFTASLAGARIEMDESQLHILREAGDMVRAPPEALHLQARQSAVWDGRFEIVAEADLTLTTLAGSTARLSKSDRAGLNRLPARSRPAWPSLVQGETVSLPRPLGEGPARARWLGHDRFIAACGLVVHERDISPPCGIEGMAQSRRSSYVGALALA